MTLGQNDNKLPLRRDAFHVPCILAMQQLGQTLRAGDRVRFVPVTSLTAGFSESMVCLAGVNECHGVIDPFADVKAGDLVWVLVRPDLLDGPLTHSFKLKFSTTVPTVPKIEVEGIEEEEPEEYNECDTMGPGGGPCD